MKCPVCRSGDSTVTQTMKSEDGRKIFRRRKCTSCKTNFTTTETVTKTSTKGQKPKEPRHESN